MIPRKSLFKGILFNGVLIAIIFSKSLYADSNGHQYVNKESLIQTAKTDISNLLECSGGQLELIDSQYLESRRDFDVLLVPEFSHFDINFTATYRCELNGTTELISSTYSHYVRDENLANPDPNSIEYKGLRDTKRKFKKAGESGFLFLHPRDHYIGGPVQEWGMNLHYEDDASDTKLEYLFHPHSKYYTSGFESWFHFSFNSSTCQYFHHLGSNELKFEKGWVNGFNFQTKPPGYNKEGFGAGKLNCWSFSNPLNYTYTGIDPRHPSGMQIIVTNGIKVVIEDFNAVQEFYTKFFTRTSLRDIMKTIHVEFKLTADDLIGAP